MIWASYLTHIVPSYYFPSLTWNCFSRSKCQSIIFSRWFQFISLKESGLREWYFSVIITKKYHRSIMEVSSYHVVIAFLSSAFVPWMFWAHSGQYSCPLGVTCLPNMGTLLAPLGHAACPGWAELQSDKCPISWCCNTHIPVFRILPMHAIHAIWQFLPSAKPSRQLADSWLIANCLLVRMLRQKNQMVWQFFAIFDFTEN